MGLLGIHLLADAFCAYGYYVCVCVCVLTVYVCVRVHICMYVWGGVYVQACVCECVSRLRLVNCHLLSGQIWLMERMHPMNVANQRQPLSLQLPCQTKMPPISSFNQDTPERGRDRRERGREREGERGREREREGVIDLLLVQECCNCTLKSCTKVAPQSSPDA